MKLGMNFSLYWPTEKFLSKEINSAVTFTELNYFELRLSLSYKAADWYVLQQITFFIQNKKST